MAGQSCSTNLPPLDDPSDDQVLGDQPLPPGATGNDGTGGDSAPGAADPHQAIIARGGGNQIVTEGTTVILDGSQSVGVDGRPLSFTWEQIEGPTVTLDNASTAIATFTAPWVDTNVTLTFLLAISDGTAVSEDKVQVDIVNTPELTETPPVQLSILANVASGQAPLPVEFSVNTVDGQPLPTGTYVWNFDDGGEAQGEAVTHLFAQGRATPYLVSVCVAAGAVATCDDSSLKAVLPIEVYATGQNAPPGGDPSQPGANQPPKAMAGPDLVVDAGTLVTLDGSASSDPEGQAIMFDWKQTAGPSVSLSSTTAAKPTFVAPLMNVDYMLSFKLTVHDPAVAAEDTVDVYVKAGDVPATPAGTYYVDMNDPNASDTAADAGTQAKPFKTIQKAAAVVQPGDVVYIKAGRYTSTKVRPWSGTLEVFTAGTVDRPITFKRFGNDEVIIDANSTQDYAITVGDQRNRVPSGNIILEGLKVTGAVSSGINIFQSHNVVVRDCEVYGNNKNWEIHQTASYQPGVGIIASNNCLVENCRIYWNGYGIMTYEHDHTSYDPIGSKNCIIRNNLVYCNSFSGNFGNSAGIAMRFGENSTIEGNVLWDNPDGGVVGLGMIHCRVLRNACLNSWQLPGNMEGIKLCVRGGGANLIANNISTRNEQRGLDTGDGIGDIVLNNTFYRNGQWGVLLEGRKTVLLNNIAYRNFESQGSTDLDLRCSGSLYIAAGSDYNLFADATKLPSLGGITQPHSLAGNPMLANPDMVFPRNSVTQVVHPEQLFVDANGDGRVTVEEARADIASRFVLQSGSKARNAGLSLTQAQTIAAASLPEILSAAQTRIGEWGGSGHSQWEQGANMWRRMVDNLQQADHAGYTNLSGLKDFAGNPLPMDTALNMGALQ